MVNSLMLFRSIACDVDEGSESFPALLVLLHLLAKPEVEKSPHFVRTSLLPSVTTFLAPWSTYFDYIHGMLIKAKVLDS